jgi:hypothetical protein
MIEYGAGAVDGGSEQRACASDRRARAGQCGVDDEITACLARQLAHIARRPGEPLCSVRIGPARDGVHANGPVGALVEPLDRGEQPAADEARCSRDEDRTAGKSRHVDGLERGCRQRGEISLTCR